MRGATRGRPTSVAFRDGRGAYPTEKPGKRGRMQ